MRGRRGAALAFVALLAVTPAVLSGYWTFVLTLGVIYATLALSLVVLTGWSGQLNLHVAALGFGWGAYAAYTLYRYDVPIGWALLAAGVALVPLALVVGLVAVRFRGLELAIATLAVGLIFERLVFRNLARVLTPTTGTPFESSFVSVPRPRIGGLHFEGDTSFFYLCLVFAVVVFVVVANVGRGATGRTLHALREREVAAETLGVPVVRHRIGAFATSIIIAGTAGALFASFERGIVPDTFNLDLSFQILAATIIGGIRSPSGAVIGGGMMALLPEVVRFGPLQAFGGERLFFVFGIGMILVLWRLPGGLAGWSARVRVRGVRHRVAVQTGSFVAGIAANGAVTQRRYRSRLDRLVSRPVLNVDDLHVRFGGVVALDGVSVFVPPGEICALIGPNGAGKSTLFNSVSGLVPPASGRVYLDGRDITETPANGRVALGLGRTFQTVEVFRELTVFENVLAAGHLLRSAGPVRDAFRLAGARSSERALAERATSVLAELGLTGVADRLPGDLPLAPLRILEIGMALAAGPRLLLLDEPSAGLDENETAALASLIASLRDEYGFAVLLVEHDMSMVSALAEHVYVLDFGRIIAQGTPDEIRRDPLVLERYLGTDWALADEPRRDRSRRQRAAR
jgi:branched-chain amino acid transport system permease protein